MAAAQRRECCGGPYDGQLAAGPPMAVAWIDGSGRAHAQPGRGRVAYCLDGLRWRFAGHGFRRCSECGAFLAPEPDGGRCRECPLCGRGDA